MDPKQSQSDFMHDRQDNDGLSDIFENMQACEYNPRQGAQLPAEWQKLVIWGLGGTIVHFPPKLAQAYGPFTHKALLKIAGSKLKETPTVEDIAAMVAESYANNRTPTRAVAKKYGVNEGMLLQEMQSLVFQEEICFNRGNYGMANKGDMAAFYESVERGIVHYLLSSGSSNFAESALHSMGLRHHFKRIMGFEVCNAERRYDLEDKGITDFDENKAPVIHKGEDAALSLRAALRDVPEDRYGDVIVVDHNLRFLRKAKATGLKAILMGHEEQAISDAAAEGKTLADYKASFKPRGIDHVVWSTQEVFKKFLAPAQVVTTGQAPRP